MYKRISFLGDLMCSSNQIMYYEENGNYNEIFEEMISYFKDSEYVVGNMETPIAGKECGGYTNNKVRWQFNTPYKFAQEVFNAGISIVTTANNHCLNRGVEGVDNTLINLKKIGFQTVGTNLCREDKRYILVNVNNMKIAIHSYTYGTNAFDDFNYLKKQEKYKVNLLQEQELYNPLIRQLYLSNKLPWKILMRLCRKIEPSNFAVPIYERKEKNCKQMSQLKNDILESKKDGADIVIACLHIGGQYNEKPTDYAKEIAEKTISYGADIIIGNHEHVIHGPVFYSDKFTVFSLGNFTATTGVHREPFGIDSEYSIILNVYIGEKTNINYSFSICKSIAIDANRVKTVLLYDLIKEEKDEYKKSELIKANERIVLKMTSDSKKAKKIAKEYYLER